MGFTATREPQACGCCDPQQCRKTHSLLTRLVTERERRLCFNFQQIMCSTRQNIAAHDAGTELEQNSPQDKQSISDPESLFAVRKLKSCQVVTELTVQFCRLPSAASSTTGPESVSERDGGQLLNKSPSSWSIEEVMQFVRDADPTALAPHAELFRKHVGLPSLCWPVYVQNLGEGVQRLLMMSHMANPFGQTL